MMRDRKAPREKKEKKMKGEEGRVPFLFDI